MTHTDEGTLQALVDGELPEVQRSEVERHLAACAACRAGLEELRAASGQLGAALALLEPPRPRARRPAVAAPRRSAPPVWRAGRSLARAAVLVLGFAAVGSATIPGSPVRRWLGEMLEPRGESVAVAERAAAPAESAASEPTVMSTAASSAADEAGVSVAPSRGEVRVVLRDAAPALRVRAVLVERDLAGVYARDEAAEARFSTAPGRIEVVGAGPGELRVELPRGARSATVMVNGRAYLTKEGDQLRLAVPADDSSAAEVSFRVQP